MAEAYAKKFGKGKEEVMQMGQWMKLSQKCVIYLEVATANASVVSCHDGFTHVLHSWYLCIQSFVLFFACFCTLLHANSRLSKVSVTTKPRKAKFDAAQLPYEFSEAALVS